tara:strand:- start:2296 stop:2799 length:504 start_codon:yes stop_codon:yes gene_type:complete
LSADKADNSVKRIFFHMTCQIGGELHNKTSAFTPKSATNGAMQVLDIYIAPRSFSSYAQSPSQRKDKRDNPPEIAQCGHDILLHDWRKAKRVQVHFADVTMLAAEMEVLADPSNHPDALNFRPFTNQKFDLIFCDGQVLRMHQRADYREKREAWRPLTRRGFAANHT